jgi:hypothetical protein
MSEGATTPPRLTRQASEAMEIAASASASGSTAAGDDAASSDPSAPLNQVSRCDTETEKTVIIDQSSPPSSPEPAAKRAKTKEKGQLQVRFQSESDESDVTADPFAFDPQSDSEPEPEAADTAMATDDPDHEPSQATAAVAAPASILVPGTWAEASYAHVRHADERNDKVQVAKKEVIESFPGFQQVRFSHRSMSLHGV